MIYLDSSALLTLVRTEEHTAALRAWLHDRSDAQLISSAVARVEVVRACRRIDERPLDAGRAVIAAPHLASALRIGLDLQTFAAYDEGLLGVADVTGLPVIRLTT